MKIRIQISQVLCCAVVMASQVCGGELKSSYDVVIAGAGTGGFGAAVQAARMGASVLLLDETDWIGGQMNAAAVTSMDEGRKLVRERGIYREFVDEVKAFYKPLGKSCETAYWHGHICLEPRVGRKILQTMLDKARGSGTLDISLLSRVTKVMKNGDTVTGVEIETGLGERRTRTVQCKILIDATEWGDVIPLTGARYRVGNCTSDSIDPVRKIQDLTWTAVVKEYPKGVPSDLLIREKPPGYAEKIHQSFLHSLTNGDKVGFKDKPWTFATFIGYRGMPDSSTGDRSRAITRTHLNYNNDFPVSIGDVESATSRVATCRAARLKTLHLLHYIQTTLGETNWAVANDEGFDSPFNGAEIDAWLKECPELKPYRPVLTHFSVMAYARESRRIIGLHTLSAPEIERKNGMPVQFADAVALGDYAIDLHGSMSEKLIEREFEGPTNFPSSFGGHGIGPFAIPFRCFIPEKIDGFLPAEKNISQSRLANGATRLQPSTMLMGQAAGAIAALSAKYRVQPRHLAPVLVQQALLNAGGTLFLAPFRDLARDAREWKAAQLVAVHGMLVPEDRKFGPDRPVSATQLSEITKQLFASDSVPETGPATRATFAEMIGNGLADSKVKLDFAGSSADGAKPITRSEAAQIVADVLEKRALAKMTSEPQTIDWTIPRPVTPASKFDLSADDYASELRLLTERKIIDAPEYWLEHSAKGQTIDGARVLEMITRAAQAFDSTATVKNAVDVLGEHRCIGQPSYWLTRAVAGGNCDGATVAILIGNIAQALQ